MRRDKKWDFKQTRKYFGLPTDPSEVIRIPYRDEFRSKTNNMLGNGSKEKDRRRKQINRGTI